jgi:hypothetical protein
MGNYKLAHLEQISIFFFLVILFKKMLSAYYYGEHDKQRKSSKIEHIWLTMKQILSFYPRCFSLSQKTPHCPFKTPGKVGSYRWAVLMYGRKVF